MLVKNHHDESILLTRLKSTSEDTINIVSNDGVSFKMPKFIFTFFSDVFEDVHDCILAPMTSTNLNMILQFLRIDQNENILNESCNLVNYFIQEAEALCFNKIGLENYIDALNKRRNKASEDEKRKVNVPHFKNALKVSFVSESPYISDEANNSGKFEVERPILKVEAQNLDCSNSSNIEREKLDDLHTNKELNQKNEEPCHESSEQINKYNEADYSNSANTGITNDSYDKKNLFDIKAEFKGKHKEKQKLLIDKRVKIKVGNPIVEWETKDNSDSRVTRMKSLECRLCGKIFSRQKHRHKLAHYYDIHYRKHEIQNFVCDCDYVSNSYNDKERHYKTVHLSLYGCTVGKCPTYLKTKESLGRHMENFHRCFTCDECGQLSKSKRLFKKHQYVHAKHESYSLSNKNEVIKCIPCDLLYTDKLLLQRHNSKVHKPKICPNCGKTVNNLPLHLKHHQSEESRQYHCDTCGKGFINRSRLKAHLQLHSGVLFKCRYPSCVKNNPEYKDPSNRDAHERKKHGLIFSKLKQALDA